MYQGTGLVLLIKSSVQNGVLNEIRTSNNLRLLSGYHKSGTSTPYKVSIPIGVWYLKLNIRAFLAAALVTVSCNHGHASSKPLILTFGPFSGSGHSYVVKTRMNENVAASMQGVCELEISTTDGEVLWRKSLPAPHRDGHYVATAYDITALSGHGFGIEYAELRSGRIPSGHLELFSIKNDGLKPFSESISFEGTLEHFPDVGPQKRKLVGDRAIYQLWTGYFFVLGRATIFFDRSNLEQACHQRCLMPVVPDKTMVREDASVYASNRVDGGRAMLALRKGTSVTMVDAMVPSVSGLMKDTGSEINRPLLHFRYAGRDFWTGDPHTFIALGLAYKARADQR